MDMEGEDNWRHISDNYRERFLQENGWAGKSLGREPLGSTVAEAIRKAGFCH